MNTMIGQQIKQVRLARGLSLEELAARLGGIVTKQALSKYETGKSKPSSTVLARLAETLEVKMAYLLSEPSLAVDFIAYRKKASMPVKEQEFLKGRIMHQMEGRVRLQEMFSPNVPFSFPLQEYKVDTLEDAEQAALDLRDAFLLGRDPIGNLVTVLEANRLHVLEVESSDKFDGISAIARSTEGKPVAGAVVTRLGLSGERQRLSRAHELGHLVLSVSPEVDEEKAAFRFAGAFLSPAEVFVQDVGSKRTAVSSSELFALKQKYGMSLQALLYRMKVLGIISDTYHTEWCIAINRNGWKREEPGPLPLETPLWLRQHVLRAHAEGMVSTMEAETLLGEKVGEESLSLVKRRAFMKLPLSERRRIMSEQADRLATHYEKDTEWREIEGTEDIIEY
jgi:transcriptional regulator with XRE-family HTH domain